MRAGGRLKLTELSLKCNRLLSTKNPLAALFIKHHHETNLTLWEGVNLIKYKEKVLDNIMSWINTTSFKKLQFL